MLLDQSDPDNFRRRLDVSFRPRSFSSLILHRAYIFGFISEVHAVLLRRLFLARPKSAVGRCALAARAYLNLQDCQLHLSQCIN